MEQHWWQLMTGAKIGMLHFCPENGKIWELPSQMRATQWHTHAHKPKTDRWQNWIRLQRRQKRNRNEYKNKQETNLTNFQTTAANIMWFMAFPYRFILCMSAYFHLGKILLINISTHGLCVLVFPVLLLPIHSLTPPGVAFRQQFPWTMNWNQFHPVRRVRTVCWTNVCRCGVGINNYKKKKKTKHSR